MARANLLTLLVLVLVGLVVGGGVGFGDLVSRHQLFKQLVSQQVLAEVAFDVGFGLFGSLQKRCERFVVPEPAFVLDEFRVDFLRVDGGAFRLRLLFDQ